MKQKIYISYDRTCILYIISSCYCISCVYLFLILFVFFFFFFGDLVCSVCAGKALFSCLKRKFRLLRFFFGLGHERINVSKSFLSFLRHLLLLLVVVLVF